jgi:cell division septal protein FtsQ
MPEYNESRRRKPISESRSMPPRSAVRNKPKPQAVTQPSVEKQEPIRRQRTKAKPRHKKNLTIYYAMFLFVAVVVFSVLSVTVLFNLEQIFTEGESVYTHEQLIEAAGVTAGVNLIRLNTEVFRQNILDELIYIDRVNIRKSFPNRLTISVVGAVEMANIEHNGIYYIISKNGRILGEADIITGNTVIYGFEAYEPVVGDYIQSEDDRKNNLIYNLMDAINKTELPGITSINITDRQDIRLNYMNRVELFIGPEAELEIKFTAAAEMLANVLPKNESGTLRMMELPMLVFASDMPEPLRIPEAEILEIIGDEELLVLH